MKKFNGYRGVHEKYSGLRGVVREKNFILPMKQLHLGTVLSPRDGIHIKVFYLHIGVCRPP